MQPLTGEGRFCTTIYETRILSPHISVISLYFSIAKIPVGYASVKQSNYWTEQVTTLQWAYMDEDPESASPIRSLSQLEVSPTL